MRADGQHVGELLAWSLCWVFQEQEWADFSDLGLQCKFDCLSQQQCRGRQCAGLPFQEGRGLSGAQIFTSGILLDDSGEEVPPEVEEGESAIVEISRCWNILYHGRRLVLARSARERTAT